MAEILPGVYIEVRPEALIVPGPITVGNIGIVGTARQGPIGKVNLKSSFADAKEEFGDYDPFDQPDPDGPHTLVRSLQLAYGHGASRVYAVRTGGDTTIAHALKSFLTVNVHIVVVAGEPAEDVSDVVQNHLREAFEMNLDRIAVVGSRPKGEDEDVDDFLNAITGHQLNNDRLIFVAPGIEITDLAKAAAGADDTSVILPGAYAAAAVAGMLSARSPHVSPTNKTLSIRGLEVKFNPAQLADLVEARVLALEQRRGYRVVKGITTHDGAFQQITTRRIVDYAKYGVRSAAEPYIGLLNNDRVRKALKGSINGFLAGMVDDEMLISYALDVTATREEERRGIAKVTMTLLPTFSIDYIKVVMYLE